MFEVLINDSSAVAEARRRAVALAVAQGFDEVRAGQLAIAATELGTNLLKHGGGGRLLVGHGPGCLALLALDRGPGMADVGACLADGFSSAGTAGNGLGAVRRLAQRFHVASWPGRGTAVFACFVRSGSPEEVGRGTHDDTLAGLSVPKPGEQACGDGWAAHDDADGRRTVFMVDGLGHGTEAAVAANEALAQFQRSRHEPPTQILHAVHQALRHTRGGAVAVARIDPASATVAFAGLGNIAATVLVHGAQARRMVSHNGTAGHNARKIQAFDYPCGHDGLLVMHSDGIGTGWALDAYPGLPRMHPMLVAGVLYRDFVRGRDDATVVVARTGRP
ncbi:SpoIIE family protein phosphatase [Azohydromonas caseinilytica]|uniref:SpoIIE family protein phosphatase n=1 Tax=Azohydromonas caseinilytica TaxID=2728836 RepID=A0A848FC24_9BURK|nr:SpoIIE family protein phosphatase [Azohydromonas caseinilytica]NML16872.1 SpoIIE family protein phosphatase [Azohydromonas caseinilytica]